MRHYLQPVDYVLWCAVITLQWLALVICRAGRFQRQMPLFMLYLTLLCVKSSLLFLLSIVSYAWYFWAFYAVTEIETILLVLVIYEIFRNTFDPLGVLPPGTIARMVGWMIVSAIIILTIGIWKPAQTSSFADSVTALLRTVHRTTACTIAVALWSLVMYARSLAIPWRSRTAGIASGFLILFTLEGFTRVGQSVAPHAWFAWFDRLLSMVFLAVLFIWVRATRRPEAVSTELPTPEALKKVSKSMAEMRSVLASVKVVLKTKWSVE